MIVELLAAAVLACLVSAVLCPLVMAAGVMDAPDRTRKQQKTPIPTSGGLAIAIGFAVACAGLLSWPQAQWSLPLGAGEMWSLAGALTAVAAALVMGLADDVFPLPARFKFGVVAVIGLLFSLFVARAQAFPIAAGVAVELGLFAGVLGSTLWLFTIVNATNFIDGANGLAMGSSAIGLVCLGIVGLISAAPHAAALAFCGAGALVGFLFWNFPKGAVFAGDAGSLFAGMLAAVVGLILAQDAGVSPVIAAIAFFPILADVLLTLAWRVGQRRANLFDGHREHLYQIGLRAGMSHRRVALVYWAATLHCGLIAIIAAHAQRIPPPGAFLPQAGDVSPEQAMFVQATAWLAALSPYLALAVLAMVSLKAAGKVRAFARARGLDQE
jgi:UDP-N-acetylmuramyl pentapeptide phosphotransferase/UDP-N-acetylglucosamine-1-phosphate transferase